jgi:cysteine desulfurase/selenocysteine lyase
MTPFLPTDIRSQFPGSQDKVHLNIAETGLIPVSSAAVAHAYVDHALMGTGDKTAYRESVERCREGLAQLLAAHPDEVAITKNVSEALNLFASSFPWKAGDNVVFCPELEHPNNVFLWYNLRKLKGIESGRSSLATDRFRPTPSRPPSMSAPRS